MHVIFAQAFPFHVQGLSVVVCVKFFLMFIEFIGVPTY